MDLGVVIMRCRGEQPGGRGCRVCGCAQTDGMHPTGIPSQSKEKVKVLTLCQKL